MAKLDARRIAGFLAAPGETRVVLLHGEDQGLVRERGAALVQAVAAGDAFRMVDIAREAAVKDAGLLAAAILALADGDLARRLDEKRAAQTAAVAEIPVDEPGNRRALPISLIQHAAPHVAGGNRTSMASAPSIMHPCLEEIAV